MEKILACLGSMLLAQPALHYKNDLGSNPIGNLPVI